MRQTISLSLLVSLFATLGCSSEKGGDNKEALVANQTTSSTESTSPVETKPTAPLTSSETPAKPSEEVTPLDNIPVITTPVSGAIGPVALNFAAKVQGEELKCSDKSQSMMNAGQVFTDVRMFISNVVLVNDEGEEVKIALDQVQDAANLQFVDANSNTIALLNFLDASCASSDATKTLKNAISGVLPYGHYKALKFQVGLPYAAMDESLTKVPAALAPTDMAWMWEHYPAEFQIEAYDGATRKLINALVPMSATKPSITLALDYTHGRESVGPKVQLELSKLFTTTASAFVKGLEKACTNSTKVMTEASPNCAQAYKALGLEVTNPKEAYTQSVFSIVP